MNNKGCLTRYITNFYNMELINVEPDINPIVLLMSLYLLHNLIDIFNITLLNFCINIFLFIDFSYSFILNQI